MELLTIGKVAKKCNIPVKTLRYYDEIGLLKPAKVSTTNHYRYYTELEIQKIPLIKYYKELGFKLDDIKKLLTNYELNNLDNYFDKELTIIEEEIERLKKQYFAMKEWKNLVQVGKEEKNKLKDNGIEIQLSYMPVYETAAYEYSHYHVEQQMNQTFFSNAFVEFCRNHQYYTYGPFILHFDDIQDRFKSNNITVQCHSEVIEPINRKFIRKIGGLQTITSVHIGGYAQLPILYDYMIDWAKQQNVQLEGDVYERYLIDSWSTCNESEYVTEVIMPLAIG